jgi:hypothetical protein
VAIELHDPVLHLVAIDDEDRQHAVPGKTDELDLRQRSVGLARHRYDACEVRQARDELRRRGNQRLRVAGTHVEVALELGDLGLVGRLVTQERVDEITVTFVCRHAACRGMWRTHETVFLEVRDHVPDRRGRKAEPRLPRQRSRADGLAVADVTLDERAQELLRTIVRLGVDTAGRVRHKSLLQKENDKWFECSDQTSNRTPRVSRTVARQGPAC